MNTSLFFKKHWSNILFGVLVVLMIIPQTRMPIQVFVQRIIAFSPSETSKEKRETLRDYDWILQNRNNEEVNLKDAKGKVILINSWATWCPPCVAEMPSLQKLYDVYGDEVQFYFVTSENPKPVDKFMEKHQYNLPVYYQEYASPEQLQSRALPTTFVLSKNGEIVVKETGVADWNSKKIRNLLDKLLAE